MGFKEIGGEIVGSKILSVLRISGRKSGFFAGLYRAPRD